MLLVINDLQMFNTFSSCASLGMRTSGVIIESLPSGWMMVCSLITDVALSPSHTSAIPLGVRYLLLLSV